MKDSIVIVARHGERLDYVTRDAGGNWTATADRPFDTPLTDHGKEQGYKLGKHLSKETERLKLSGISEIYSSPFLRCRQTAVAALKGALEKSQDPTAIPPVRVELGLAESINESWYRSWALPGSNGTWGYLPPGVDRKNHVVDPESLHPLSKQQVQPLLDWKASIENGGDEESLRLSLSYESKTSLDTPYCYHPRLLESGEDQRRRMLHAVETVREPGKTVLLVSHGGPVTHLYEELTGNPWHVHGESTYCCYSIYKKSGDGRWETLAVNESDYLHENMVTERHVSDLKE